MSLHFCRRAKYLERVAFVDRHKRQSESSQNSKHRCLGENAAKKKRGEAALPPKTRSPPNFCDCFSGRSSFRPPVSPPSPPDSGARTLPPSRSTLGLRLFAPVFLSGCHTSCLDSKIIYFLIQLISLCSDVPEGKLGRSATPAA